LSEGGFACLGQPTFPFFKEFSHDGRLYHAGIL
jgi:hypothetical protein